LIQDWRCDSEEAADVDEGEAGATKWPIARPRYDRFARLRIPMKSATDSDRSHQRIPMIPTEVVAPLASCVNCVY
jgi:hypothetical protein